MDLHGVVGLVDSLLFGPERIHGQHRSEDLVRPNLVVRLDIDEHGGLQEVALRQVLDTWHAGSRQTFAKRMGVSKENKCPFLSSECTFLFVLFF